MPSTNVLDEARDLVKKRLAELDDERRRLERALVELGGKRVVGRRPGRPRARAGHGRAPKGPSPSSSRWHPRRSGGRLIEKNPGITASEIAKTMKIKPNYLYRVLGDLEKQGRVKKKGRTYSASTRATLVWKPAPPAFHFLETGRARSTASRSSRSSAALASIRSRENSGTSRPSTIVHSPPEQLHGRPATIPASTP